MDLRVRAGRAAVAAVRAFGRAAEAEMERTAGFAEARGADARLAVGLAAVRALVPVVLLVLRLVVLLFMRLSPG